MRGFHFVPNPPFKLGAVNDAPTLLRWQQLQQQLLPGTALTGQVFATAPFGVFYDAGVGFPARMNITDFGVTAEGERVHPDDYPGLGSIMHGEVSGFDKSTQQVVTVKSYRRWRGLPEDAEPI